MTLPYADLADLFGSLGGIQTGENIRKGKAFVQKIVVSKDSLASLPVS